jgi:hypothetical protein
MHVDAMLVGHVEAHQAKGILQPRVLAEFDLAHVRLAPIDVVGVELRSVEGAGQHPDLLLLQVVGLLDEPRHQIEARHAVGHPPVGEEVDGLDGGAHGGGLPLRLAGDHAMPQLHLMALDGLKLKAGTLTST